MTTAGLSIATWNVNSLRRRIESIGWLSDEAGPDIICLQETKVTDDLFPGDALSKHGYPFQAHVGMKGYNGVAIISRLPLRNIEVRSWCEREDARHIFAIIDTGSYLGEIEVHSVYVPAGGDIPDPLVNPKFEHKLSFLSELSHWWAARAAGTRQIMVGDFNIAPLESDVWSHERLKRTVTHTEIEIAHLASLQKSAHWVDAIRLFHPADEPVYTWWSYRAADWELVNKGRRLDHIWISDDLAEHADGITVFRETRDWTPPSDHVPVILSLK